MREFTMIVFWEDDRENLHEQYEFRNQAAAAASRAVKRDDVKMAVVLMNSTGQGQRFYRADKVPA